MFFQRTEKKYQRLVTIMTVYLKIITINLTMVVLITVTVMDQNLAYETGITNRHQVHIYCYNYA